MTSEPIILANPMRYFVPIGTAIGAVIMFVVPVVLAGITGIKVSVGAGVLLVCVLWLFRSAYRAPHGLRLDKKTLTIERLAGPRDYAFADVRKWWFAIPDGPPTQSPPATNGVLYLTLTDSTRFRGEVSAEQAAEIARMLPTSTK